MNDADIQGTWVFRLTDYAVVQPVGDGGLLLHTGKHQLIELNPKTKLILDHTDGQRQLSDIVAKLANEFGISGESAFFDATSFYIQLTDLGLAEVVYPDQRKEVKNMVDSSVRYIADPDVVVREQDEDQGALLFNPDTNQVQLLNVTGLSIWNMLGEGCTIKQIISNLVTEYEDVPEDEVTADIKDFIEILLNSNFLGTVS